MVIPSVAHVGAVLLAAGSANAALYGKTISTKYGEVVGYPAFNSTPTVNLSNWVDITVWKGIPFAASTAGENRWRAPQPAEPWNTTLQAREYGPVCPDATTNDNYTFSEDCLNLNIWSAAKSSDAKLPVVMWSYPGLSTARDALFDGAGMADKEIVFVNYNYRAGAFGWMAHPQLSQEVFAETGHNSSGNWGMLDQFAALKWIHENIAVRQPSLPTFMPVADIYRLSEVILIISRSWASPLALPQRITSSTALSPRVSSKAPSSRAVSVTHMIRSASLLLRDTRLLQTAWRAALSSSKG